MSSASALTRGEGTSPRPAMDTQTDTALRPDPLVETDRRAPEPSQALDPKGELARFSADEPLRTDAGVDLAPFQIAYQTAGVLNAAPLQRGADLPRAHRRPAFRPHPSGHRQGRLVGDAGRSGQADRHRPLLRRLLERDRLVHGLDRSGVDRSGHGPRLRPRLPAGHRPRHGARPGDAVGPPRHRQPVPVHRRLDGRDAGAAMGSALPRARVRGDADRHRRAPLGPEHRLPRGRPAGDHGRSGLGRRALPRRGHAAVERPRRRADGRAHHIPLGAGAAPQVRGGGSRAVRRRPSRSTPTSRSRVTCATRD